MKSRRFSGGNLMEVGVAIFAAAVIGAIVALVSGRVMTGANRRRGHSEKAPAPGGVSDERHHNVSVVASR